MKSPETADGSRGCVPSATLCYPPQHTESFRDVTLLSPRRTWISSRLENKPLMWWKWILSCSQCKEKKNHQRKHMALWMYKWILPPVNQASNTSQWTTIIVEGMFVLDLFISLLSLQPSNQKLFLLNIHKHWGAMCRKTHLISANN